VIAEVFSRRSFTAEDQIRSLASTREIFCNYFRFPPGITIPPMPHYSYFIHLTPTLCILANGSRVKHFSLTVTQKQRTLQPNSERLLPSFDPIRNYMHNAYQHTVQHNKQASPRPFVPSFFMAKGHTRYRGQVRGPQLEK